MSLKRRLRNSKEANMTKELLARIEKLEQALQDIWASCSCLRKELDREEMSEEPENLCGGEDILNCEPFEDELEDLPEEPEDIIICYEPPDEIEEEEPERPEEKPEEDYDD
jgi:hypothetical protein